MIITIEKYSAIFGRSPLLVHEPNDSNHVVSAFFPEINAGFFKRLMAEGTDQNIYITAGFSRYRMNPPKNLEYKPETRVELIAQTNGQITCGESVQEDVVTNVLLTVTNFIIENSLFIEPGHTLDFQQPIAVNSEMTSYLFTVPEHLDIKRICKANKGCQNLISLIPISENELNYTKQHGILALIDIFEKNNVHPLFDPFRPSSL